MHWRLRRGVGTLVDLNQLSWCDGIAQSVPLERIPLQRSPGAQLFNLCELTPSAMLRGACLFAQTQSAVLVLNLPALRAYFTGMSRPASQRSPGITLLPK